MLKIILMLDCNYCGESFDRIITSSERDPMAWKALSQDLEYKAENCGWSFHRSAHHCVYCVTDVMQSGNTHAPISGNTTDDC
jgi:NifB/MoaA-like Fe-S oxidoreductase